MKNSQFREAFRKEYIPFFYWGIGHGLVNFLLLFFPLMAFVLKIHSPSFIELLLIPLTIILSNLTVFLVHKYVLHREIKFLGFAYKIHSKWHHRFFTHDHLSWDKTRDFFVIFFPIDVILGFIILVLPFIYFTLTPLISSNGVFIVMATSCFYFICYELMHFISHLPQKNFLMKFSCFSYMQNYHRNHHNLSLMDTHNFNIVFPLFDLVFKTNYKENKNDSVTFSSKKT